jgi:hypothetical protein
VDARIRPAAEATGRSTPDVVGETYISL